MSDRPLTAAELQALIRPPTLRAGQTCRVRIFDLDSRSARTIHESVDVRFEAPNWGNGELLLNGDGLLWSLGLGGVEPPRQIPVEGLPSINNDHVLAPDRRSIFLSGDDGNLYSAPVSGGTARAITDGDGTYRYFLHGVHPGGERLAYIALEESRAWDNGTVRILDLATGEDRAVTRGRGRDDGSEYSPDGEWLYFNTERFTETSGHAQIARIREDGSAMQRLSRSDRVDWFPHLSPTGDLAVYLSFPPGTQGHPADRPVALHLVATASWDPVETVLELQGGQGTINVNSWSPDGSAFAFVDYPF